MTVNSYLNGQNKHASKHSNEERIKSIIKSIKEPLVAYVVRNKDKVEVPDERVNETFNSHNDNKVKEKSIGNEISEYIEAVVDEEIEKGLYETKVGLTWFEENAENL